jgi:glycosyltransferase involved in cell wall biosynthesis
MQLLLATKKKIGDKDFLKNLASYKYRDEVRVLENVPVEILARVTASAYALVNVESRQGFCLAAAEALVSELPVITSRDNFSAELCDDAAIYIKPDDFNDIAEKMMLLFKDEDKRNELIIKGRQRILENDHDWNKRAALLWQTIEQCTG